MVGREQHRNRQKEAVGGKTQSAGEKRLLRQLDREQKMRASELEKIAPPPMPHPTRLYLSKEPSVLAQELKPLSPGAGALSPGASASSAAGGRRGSASLSKAGRLSERQLSDYSPPEGLTLQVEGSVFYRSLHPAFFLRASLHMTPGAIRADRAPDWLSAAI